MESIVLVKLKLLSTIIRLKGRRPQVDSSKVKVRIEDVEGALFEGHTVVEGIHYDGDVVNITALV